MIDSSNWLLTGYLQHKAQLGVDFVRAKCLDAADKRAFLMAWNAWPGLGAAVIRQLLNSEEGSSANETAEEQHCTCLPAEVTNAGDYERGNDVPALAWVPEHLIS